MKMMAMIILLMLISNSVQKYCLIIYILELWNFSETVDDTYN